MGADGEIGVGDRLLALIPPSLICGDLVAGSVGIVQNYSIPPRAVTPVQEPGPPI